MLSYVIAFASTAAFLICFLLVSKLMAIEMILIFQITYAALILLKKVELFMRPLRSLWIVNGFLRYFTKDNFWQILASIS